MSKPLLKRGAATQLRAVVVSIGGSCTASSSTVDVVSSRTGRTAVIAAIGDPEG